MINAIMMLALVLPTPTNQMEQERPDRPSLEKYKKKWNLIGKDGALSFLDRPVVTRRRPIAPPPPQQPKIVVQNKITVIVITQQKICPDRRHHRNYNRRRIHRGRHRCRR